MKLNNRMNILIVGLGLIGGSYAKALTQKGYTVTAITRSEASIQFALDKGWIADGATTVEEHLVRDADLVVFALYPHIFVEWIQAHQRLFKPGTVITDVTGVKGNIADNIQSILRADVEFIPAHPMAGREVSGVENADETIFYGANYIVTPTEKNTPTAIELCEDLGHELGFARVSRLSPTEHDGMIAFLSQLTHCIAVSLMTCNDEPGMSAYTGDSFRDLTRIARINDAMWSELFLENRDELLKSMETFEKQFALLKSYIQTGDREAMRDMMRKSTERRAQFDKPKPKR